MAGKDNDTPEEEYDFTPEDASAFLASLTDNPKPDTAQGVGDLLERTAEFVETRVKAEPILISDPATGALINAIRSPHGAIEYIPQSKFDEAMPGPRFRHGTATMTSLDSFVAHVNRFGDADSAVFACDDRNSPKLMAVLDYHRQDTLVSTEEDKVGERQHGDYRHGKHRTMFEFPLSDEWKAWIASDGEQMNMGAFARFLEDRMNDIALIEDDVPESAARFVEVNGGAKRIADYGKLVELARGLRINENSVVEEAVNLASGEGKIRLSSDHEAKVGQDTITVPTMFFIAIPVFRNGDFYRLPARLRYRKTPSGLTFWYDLWNADRAFDTAFREGVEKVDQQTEAQVFYGSPE